MRLDIGERGDCLALQAGGREAGWFLLRSEYKEQSTEQPMGMQWVLS